MNNYTWKYFGAFYRGEQDYCIHPLDVLGNKLSKGNLYIKLNKSEENEKIIDKIIENLDNLVILNYLNK